MEKGRFFDVQSGSSKVFFFWYSVECTVKIFDHQQPSEFYIMFHCHSPLGITESICQTFRSNVNFFKRLPQRPISIKIIKITKNHMHPQRKKLYANPTTKIFFIWKTFFDLAVFISSGHGIIVYTIRIMLTLYSDWVVCYTMQITIEKTFCINFNQFTQNPFTFCGEPDA